MKVPNAKKVGGKDDKVGTQASNFHNSPDPAGFELNGEKISEWHSSELVGCLFVVGNCRIPSAAVCVFCHGSVADIQACCESKKCDKVRNNMTALEDKKFCILAADKVVHTCIQYTPIASDCSHRLDVESKWKQPCCWRFRATAVSWASFQSGPSSEPEWHCQRPGNGLDKEECGTKYTKQHGWDTGGLLLSGL